MRKKYAKLGHCRIFA